MVRLLAFFSLVFIPGCAWFGTKSTPAEEMNAAPKVAHKYEVPKPAKREPGALWSEDSRWNNIYSSANARLVGDIITLKVNEPLKDRISLAMNQNRRVENPKNNSEAKGDAKNDSKGESREPASANPSAAKKDETSAVEATILEVLPNGSYRVGVNRAFKVGKEQPYVVMEGVIREREIASDDTASSDALMNLKLETFDEQKHAFNADKKNSPESNDKKQTVK